MPIFSRKRSKTRGRNRKIQRKTQRGGAGTRAVIRALARNARSLKEPQLPFPKVPLAVELLVRLPPTIGISGGPPAQFRFGAEPTLFSGPRQNPLFGKSGISTVRSTPFGEQRRLMGTKFERPANSTFKISEIADIKTGPGLKSLVKDPVVLKELGIEGRAAIPFVRWKVAKKLLNNKKLQGNPLENEMAVLEFEIAAKEGKENVSNLRQQLKALEEQNGGPRKSVPGLQQNGVAQAANAEALEQAVEGPGEGALGERAVAPPKPVEAKVAKGPAVANGNQALNQVAKVLQENAQNAAKRANSALKKANEAQKLSNVMARAKEETEALKAKVQQMEIQLRSPERMPEIKSTSEAVESAVARVSVEGLEANAEGAVKLVQKEETVIDNLIVVGNKDIKQASEALKPVLNQEADNIVASQIKNEAANLGDAELNSKAPEIFDFFRKLIGKGDPVILNRGGLAEAEAAFVGNKAPRVPRENNATNLMEVIKSWTPYGRALRRLGNMMKVGNKNIRSLKFQDPEIIHELRAIKEFGTKVDEGLEIILEHANRKDILQLITVFTPKRLLNFKAAMIKVFAFSVDVGTSILHLMLTKIIPGKQFNVANIDNLIHIMRFNPQGAREAALKLIEQDVVRQGDLQMGFAMNFEKGKGLFGAKAMFNILFAAGGAAVLFLACLNNIPDIKALGMALQDMKDDNNLNFQEMQQRAKLLRDAFVVDVLRQVPPEVEAAAPASASAALPKVRTWTDYTMEQIGLNPEVAADRRRFAELSAASWKHAGDVAKAAAVAGTGLAVRAAFGK